MGNIFHFTCRECDYNTELKLGAGMLSVNTSAVEGLLNEEDLSKWNTLKESESIDFFSWERKPANCNNCKEYISVVSVKIRTIDGRDIMLGNRCDKCNKNVDTMELNEHMICPICNKNTVTLRVKGRWD